MTPEQLLLELNAIFQEVFDDDDISINRESSSDDIDGWDSLANLRILVSIEQKYDVSFTAGEVAELYDVGMLIDSIIEKAQAA